MNFRNNVHQKMWLDKCLKSSVSDDPSTGEYLSSAVNILTKSLKTLHVTKGDFFQLDYFHGDL